METTDIPKLETVDGLTPDFTMLFIKAILSDKNGHKSPEKKINCSRLKKEQQYLLDKGLKYIVDITIENEKEIYLINIHTN
jgi:hypothetical protein